MVKQGRPMSDTEIKHVKSELHEAWSLLKSLNMVCNTRVPGLLKTINICKKVETLSAFFLFPANNAPFKANEQSNTLQPQPPPPPPFNVDACFVECHCEFRISFNVDRRGGKQVIQRRVSKSTQLQRNSTLFYNRL